MHFTKSKQGYYYKDDDSPYSISSVWNEQYNTSHALFSKSVINAILRITCPVSGTVLDPFAGSGTTGFVAQSMQLKFIGIEKNMQRCLKMKKEFDNMIVLS
jgi:DNA modification methylase